MNKIHGWFQKRTGLLLSMICLFFIIILTLTYLLINSIEKAKTKPLTISYANLPILKLQKPNIDANDLSDVFSFPTDSTNFVVNLTKNNIQDLSFALQQNFPKAVCMAENPSNSPKLLKIRMSLVGKCLYLDNLILNNSEYATNKCFDIMTDSLVMEKFVPIGSDDNINFETKFHSKTEETCAYKFYIEIFNNKNKIIAKYPTKKIFEEGILKSLAAYGYFKGTFNVPNPINSEPKETIIAAMPVQPKTGIDL